MKQRTLSFAAFLLLFAIGCSPKVSNDSTGETPTNDETPAPEASAEESMESDNDAYTITVVDSKPKSPRKEMSTNLGGADITVNYGSPKVKGRTIWGGLEKYGKVWRAGANEATIFTTSADIKVAGQDLAAGTYGFFMIPNEDAAWTCIFNSVAEQWGAYEYDASNDVLRVDVSPKFGEELAEELDYMASGNSVVLRWEKAMVSMEISN